MRVFFVHRTFVDISDLLASGHMAQVILAHFSVQYFLLSAISEKKIEEESTIIGRHESKNVYLKDVIERISKKRNQ